MTFIYKKTNYIYTVCFFCSTSKLSWESVAWEKTIENGVIITLITKVITNNNFSNFEKSLVFLTFLFCYEAVPSQTESIADCMTE